MTGPFPHPGLAQSFTTGDFTPTRACVFFFVLSSLVNCCSEAINCSTSEQCLMNAYKRPHTLPETQNTSAQNPCKNILQLQTPGRQNTGCLPSGHRMFSARKNWHNLSLWETICFLHRLIANQSPKRWQLFFSFQHGNHKCNTKRKSGFFSLELRSACTLEGCVALFGMDSSYSMSFWCVGPIVNSCTNRSPDKYSPFFFLNKIRGNLLSIHRQDPMARSCCGLCHRSSQKTK